MSKLRQFAERWRLKPRTRRRIAAMKDYIRGTDEIEALFRKDAPPAAYEKAGRYDARIFRIEELLRRRRHRLIRNLFRRTAHPADSAG